MDSIVPYEEDDYGYETQYRPPRYHNLTKHSIPKRLRKDPFAESEEDSDSPAI